MKTTPILHTPESADWYSFLPQFHQSSGRLCVCRSLESVAEKFHPGDVLVVPYTTNELLPYIRQAAAVISEEASAESHTATVGLTLDKPVIVGATDATRRLKDGVMAASGPCLWHSPPLP